MRCLEGYKLIRGLCRRYLCDEGFVMKNKKCIQTSCPSKEFKLVNGLCVRQYCKTGQKMINGKCYQNCPIHHKEKNNKCVRFSCDKDYKLLANGTCQRIGCKSGYVLKNEQCFSVVCEKGFKFNNKIKKCILHKCDAGYTMSKDKKTCTK